MSAAQSRVVLVGVAALVAVAAVFTAGAAVAGGAGRAAYAVTTTPTVPVGPASSGGITVSGSGQAPGTPDVLRLELGVETTGSTATAALEKSSAAMAKVVKALRNGGTRSADIRTSGLSVQATYSYSGSTPRITGYQASNTVSATLHDLARAGRVIQSAVEAGGNASRLQGVSLDLDHDDAIVAKARQVAFADARGKAEAYAKAAGRRLGPVSGVTETVASSAPVDLRGQGFDASAVRAVPVQPGSQQVGVTVQVVWSFA